MLNDNFEIKKQQALGEDTPIRILDELSMDDDKRIREAVAGNPNTPVEVLRYLGEEFPEVVRENPIFDLLFIENPKSNFIRLSLARSSTTSEDLLEKLIDSCENPNCSDDYITNESILKSIASKPNVSPEILDRLVKENPKMHDRVEAYTQVAKNPNTTTSTLDKLAVHPNEHIRSLVLKHKNVSEDTIAINELLNKRIIDDFSRLKRLADSSNEKLRIAIANNPDTPLEILEKLAEDRAAKVRLGVAKNKNISVDLLIKLARDRSKYARKTVATKKNTPLKVLADLAEDEIEEVRASVAKNSKTSEEILITLANDPDEFVLKFVAKNKKTPLSYLEEFAKHSNPDIRMNVAQNSKVPPSILEELSQDTNKDVRQKVGKHRKTPPSILEKLAEDSEEDVRIAVAKNKYTPLDILKKLYEDELFFVSHEAKLNYAKRA